MKKILNTYSIIALGAILAMTFAFNPLAVKAEGIDANANVAETGSVQENFVSNQLPNPSAVDIEEAGQDVAQPKVDANVPSPSNPPFVSNDLPNPSAVNNPDNTGSNTEESAPKKKRRSGGGHTSIVKKPVAPSAPVAVAPVITPSPVVAAPAPVVKPTVAATPTTPVVADAPVKTSDVAAAPADNSKDEGSNLAASASQSFGSRFVNFFVKLWDCAFGNECR